jgi:apolipoprotein D and lipocalin family protein
MKKKILIYLLIISVTMLGLISCATIPKNATAVKSFDKEKYLGKWYEVARFDFKFEKNLNNTTAVYSLNEDGSIKVDNKGYNSVKKQWTQSIGKAKFVGQETTAMLKVSFFGPFYGGYNVLAIDMQYKYALIAGGSLKYLWLLSRETTMPEDVKAKYLGIAESVGYDITKLLWIKHDK